MILLLNRLYDEGILKELYNAGLLSQRALTYRPIYTYLDSLLKCDYKLSEAVEKTSKSVKMSKKTIYKIYKLCKQKEIKNEL